jgi:hypothetical protein
LRNGSWRRLIGRIVGSNLFADVLPEQEQIAP